jgi:FkbM family methyltransferase
MKLKNFVQLLGFRGKPRHYGYEICDFESGTGTKVHYAQWLHPSESKKILSPEHVAAYSQVVKEGDFCIDIGAHSGDSTLPIALAAGKTGCVLALEPNPYLFHVLEKNARANRHVTNIKTMMAAAVQNEGFVQFEYSDSGFCNGGRHENISALKHGHAFNQSVWGVDLARELKSDFSDLLPRLKLIKVDAEGYDLFILRSLTEIIKSYRPVVKCEVFKLTSAQYRKEMLSLFLDLNYSVHKLDPEPIGAGPRLTPEMVNNWKHYDMLGVPNPA